MAEQRTNGFVFGVVLVKALSVIYSNDPLDDVGLVDFSEIGHCQKVMLPESLNW